MMAWLVDIYDKHVCNDERGRVGVEKGVVRYGRVGVEKGVLRCVGRCVSRHDRVCHYIIGMLAGLRS